MSRTSVLYKAEFALTASTFIKEEESALQFTLWMIDGRSGKSFLTIFQSYLDNGLLILKGFLQ